ncbi:hypothetical protein BJY04DRAFT_223638 [Aspergillus karnatakaensis]|uniref:uncharacterized protein n=1 Tax=Aspergillus karnatakaensis TaxID=1810916 RepID=UPI003CCD2B7E
MSPPIFLDMYVGFGICHHAAQQRHWMLILAPQGSTNCTFYHVKPDPYEYRHCLEVGQSLNNEDLHTVHHIGVIPAEDQKNFYAISRNIPPERCHWYLVEMLAELERAGLLYEGTAKHYVDLIPPSISEIEVNRSERHGYKADYGGIVDDLLDYREWVEGMGWHSLFFDTCYF